MAKIVIADELEESVVGMLKVLGQVDYKPADLKGALADADALVVRSATKVTGELIAGAGKLKVVARAGVGLDNVDVKACEEKGIKVINTPGASTEAVAELAIGMMICACRKIGKAHFGMKNKRWEKKELTGIEVEGKTLGIVGYGRIGRSLAEKALSLGMRVIASDPHSKSDSYATVVGLDELWKESDVISLHCILTDETKGLVNGENIKKMRDGVVIINIARGELVSEEALYSACKSGKVYSAALDVYPNEPYSGKLLELENVIFTPHIGASTHEAQGRIGIELVQRLKQELK